MYSSIKTEDTACRGILGFSLLLDVMNWPPGNTHSSMHFKFTCCLGISVSFFKLNLLKLLGYWYSIVTRIVKWRSKHMLSCQDKASHGHERCRSHQITAHSYTTCNTGGSKVSTREHRHNTVLPTPSVSTTYRKVNLELFMVESKVQTAGYRFISRVLTLSCISECTDEIQNGRKGWRGKKTQKRPWKGSECVKKCPANTSNKEWTTAGTNP